MKVQRKSSISGKINEMEIPVTEEQLKNYYDSGRNIQDCFPWLDDDEREFIMTGITPEEWKAIFG